MTLTSDQIASIRTAAGVQPLQSNGVAPVSLSARLGLNESQGPLQKGLGEIVDTAKSGFDTAKEGVSEMMHPTSTTLPGNIEEGVNAGLKTESGIATAIQAPLAPIFKPIGDMIGALGNKIGDIPAVQKFANSPAGETVSKIAEPLANAGNVAGTILGAGKTPDAASLVKNAGEKTVDVMKGDTPASVSTVDDPLHKNIVDNYTKAIKPTIAGKSDLPSLQKYNTNVVSAVKSIADNKDNLSFTTNEGETEAGRTPKSPMELSQAIDQTKQNIFKQYDALTKQTGKTGARIDTNPIAQALSEVVNNKALQISHPEAVKYAQILQDRLTDEHLDPDTVQDIIKNYNSSLEAFYRNPSYDTASKAAIDAGVVSRFREALDNTIQKATGENYQGLKKQYGALSSIEKDVAKRAVVLARQSSATGGSGIADYAQVFSGGDMVHGILSLNPALFAKGVTQSALTKLFTHLKSPDRAIQKMFESMPESTPATHIQPEAPAQ